MSGDLVSERVRETAAENSLLELPTREFRHNGPSLRCTSILITTFLHVPSIPLDDRLLLPGHNHTRNPSGNDTALITVGNLIDGPGRAVGRAVVAHNRRQQNGQKFPEARPQTPSITTDGMRRGPGNAPVAHLGFSSRAVPRSVG